MFNNEKRLSWYHEGALTLLTGTLFGATSVIVGHPFDTVKTKMQAQATRGTSNSGWVFGMVVLSNSVEAEISQLDY